MPAQSSTQTSVLVSYMTKFDHPTAPIVFIYRACDDGPRHSPKKVAPQHKEQPGFR
jgi:hypothetical protein